MAQTKDTPPISASFPRRDGRRPRAERTHRLWLLSEGYVHGLNDVAEAVRQLRGDGVNQVPDAQVALCTGFAGDQGSAAILVR